MLANAKGHTAIELLAAASCSGTAASTGTCVDISEYEGPIVVVQTISAVTGSIAGKIQTGASGGGGDAADLSGATFTSATSGSHAVQSITIEANACNKYIRYLGTITTGPAVVGVVAIGKKKYVP